MKTLLSIAGALILIWGNLFAQGGGEALLFDGINDYVGSVDNIGISGSSPRTASAWVKSAQLYSTTCCPTPFSWGAPSVGMGFGNFISSGKWYFWGYQNDINTQVVVNMEWNHHCITYDGSQVQYYLNGAVIANQSKSLNTAISPFFVGDGFDHRVDTPFNGSVDEICVWKRVLSQEEIRELTYRRLTGQERLDTNLVCYWRFDKGSGSTTIDSSSNNNHGTLTNMDTISAWVNSTIPLATGIIESRFSISAVWAGLDSNNSSIMSIDDNDISGDDAVIFGHNNDSIIFDTTDVPTNNRILLRLKRTWRLESYGTLSGNMIFDISNFGFNNVNALRLLVDDDGTFSDADTAAGLSDSTGFIAENQILQHGFYYTLGLTEYPVRIKVPSAENIPDHFRLLQNHPNPFNPTTTIEFSLLQSDFVTLKIYNILGEQVATVVSERLTAGRYNYDWDANNLASGVYLYRIQAGEYVESKKMVLLR